MVDINRWQQTASDNDLAPPDGWPEGMPRPSVNNTARADRAALKTWHDQDQWRNPFLDKNGSEKYTLSRISDTQVDILAVNVTSAFIVGQRVRIVGATTVEGHVVSVNFDSPDTELVVSIDGGADEPLAPGSCTFNGTARTIVTTNAVFGNAKAGDKLKIEGTANNDGIAEILTVDSTTQVTIIAANPYAIEDETVTPSALTLIHAAGGVVPTAPTSILLAGVHAAAEGAYDAPGSDGNDLVRRHELQPHVYKVERDLDPRGLPPKTLTAGDATRVVQVNDAGSDYELGPKVPDPQAGDASKLLRVNVNEDGYAITREILSALHFKTSDDALRTDASEYLIGGLSNLAIVGGAPDKESLTPGSTTFTAATSTIATTNAVFGNAKVGQKLVISGTVANNGTFTIATIVGDDEITVSEALTNETVTPTMELVDLVFLLVSVFFKIIRDATWANGDTFTLRVRMGTTGGLSDAQVWSQTYTIGVNEPDYLIFDVRLRLQVPVDATKISASVQASSTDADWQAKGADAQTVEDRTEDSRFALVGASAACLHMAVLAEA